MKAYSKEQIAEVRNELKAEGNVAVYKRLQMLLWRMEGKTIEETARLSERGRRTVDRICTAYTKNGIKGVSLNHKGRIGQLTFEQETEALNKLAEKAGKGQYLRIADLQADFEAMTNAKYTVPGFYYLLKRHDWRKIMPRRRHPKGADGAACEASKKLTPNSQN